MEVFDAGVGGRKGLLYVGYGERTDRDGRTVRFEGGGGGGGEPLSFAADAILSCEAKGRYRMVVTYADAEGGRRMAVIRVQGTAVDRVMGAVEALAAAASGGGTGAADAAKEAGDRGTSMDAMREAVVAAEIGGGVGGGGGGGGGASGASSPAAPGEAAAEPAEAEAEDSVEVAAEDGATGGGEGGGEGVEATAADDMADGDEGEGGGDEGEGGKDGAADALSNHATENS